MSDMKIRFRDQQTGRQVEIDAEKVKSNRSGAVVEESFNRATVGDGQIDVMLKEKRWMRDYNHHIGVNKDALSADDAAALKRALEDPRAANLSVFDALSGRELRGLTVLKTDAAGELAAVTPNLDPTGTRRPVSLTPSGHIATPDGREPQGLKQVGDGLFRAASLIDDVKGNLFDSIQAPLPLKERMLDNLVESVAAVAPGQPLPAGTDATQALQLRASSATVMLELMTGKHQATNEFKTRAFEAYERQLQKEDNPLLRDSMILNLDRLKGNLPSTLRDRVDGLVQSHAPTQPPYDKWFKNGDNTVKVDFASGMGEGFLEDNVKYFESQGFERVGETAAGQPILRKTYEKNGVETNIDLHFRHNSNDMFKSIDDKDVDMVIYSGHSGWGKNVRDSLKNLEAGSGDGKLVMTNLCVGKGELQQMRDKFPDAQVITTYNSEYFRQGGTAESHYVMNDVFEGIAARRGYSEISESSRRNNPWTSSHKREEGIDNNFIFPTDLSLRRKLLDQDHDGQADVFDRMVNFNSFNVQEDTAREFSPIPPARAANELVGTKLHFAAMSTNRISIYNELLHERNGKAEIAPGGYYAPEAGEKGMFRFERADGDTVNMSMNANYAHTSEEALRMASAYEYSLFKGQEPGWPLGRERTDNILHSLVLASQSLNSDSGYRDSAVWGEFLKAYNLPNIPLSTVASARDVEHEYYSGSQASVEQLKRTLGPDILAKLAQSDVGVIGG